MDTGIAIDEEDGPVPRLEPEMDFSIVDAGVPAFPAVGDIAMRLPAKGFHLAGDAGAAARCSER